MMILSVAKDFNKTPGFRYRRQSPGTSGEEFRDNCLEPKYLEAIEAEDALQVILDGTDGYLTSFLEEAFGGLQEKHRDQNILDTIEIISNEEPHWLEAIRGYVDKAKKAR
jgi:hypothetical protein